MIVPLRTTRRLYLAPALRRSIEYAVAIGMALLCGYWIVNGR
ncbi:MAG TPA: hypothetical protein VN661_12365 [Candidatus Acidoferrales bacterium]|nr:hypothetical protein [Candidatus Acidoferrales bacterium]